TNVYTFTDNIAYPEYVGIEVQKSGVTVNGNGYTLQGPGLHYAAYTGFDLASSINGVTITNTHVSDFNRGVALAGSAYDNVICRNTVIYCGTGVVIGLYCYDNEFYHNNFIDNAVQVSINDGCLGSCSNIWDFSSVTEDAYVSGGNYWSDHRFVCDMKAGLDQNIGSSDGICDREYEIDADNIDHFPSLYSYERSVRNTETGVEYFTIQEAIDEAGPGDIIQASGRSPQYPASVGWPELGAFVEEWLCGSLAHSDPDCWAPCAAPDWCSGADLDHSGEVNFVDFALVAQAWLAQHNPSPPYYENIDLNELLWLIGDGADETTIDGIRKRSVQEPGYADHVVEITGNHTRIEGFTIQNAADANCGVFLDQSQYNYIVSNTIADSTYGIGLFNSSHYNTVVDSHISDAEAGVVIYESNNVLVGQSRVYSNNTGISLGHSHSTQVVDNNLGSDNYAYAGVGIYGNCRDNSIRGNYTSPDTRYGIYINAANIIEDANNTITANIIDSNEYGIELTRTSDNTMSNNQISSRYGVKLWLAPNSVVLGNVMESNTGGASGIILQDSNDVNCTENEISGNFCGIRVMRCSNSSFSVNNIFNNSGYGLQIFSSDCNIVGNIVKANNGGIYIRGSSNKVIRNAITENDTGVSVDGTDNTIYRNILVNTADNAVAYEHQENQWDDGGSPARGNFWGDYASKYSEAEPQDGSLIWDTPYEITETKNVDHGPVILTSFEITKPVKPEMKKPYILGVKLTNDTNDFWEPGMDVDFCGVEQTDAHPPGTCALWPWDWEVYEPDHLQRYEIPGCVTLYPSGPGRTTERNMAFTNDWHWIEPMDWKDVIMDIILGEVSTAYSVAGFIQDCYQAYCAVPSVTYTFMPYESPLVVFSTDVTVTVPYEKQESLHASVV
ncbi:MAG: NosD domain-containing protein, partial [Planctomycetota bacterium]